MSLTSKFLNQWRKPTGRLGRMLATVLNASHSKGTKWGLQHVPVEKDSMILDVGCGGGGFVRELARITTTGKVYGIDYSEDCVVVARRTNRREIRMGRVEILNGSVSSLPFPDRMFDIVTAVNSHYYWPDLVSDMKEVLRVLKSDGQLVLIGESYKGGKYDKRDRKFLELVNAAEYSIEGLAQLVSSIGYSDIQIFENYQKGWICCVSRKPS
jgi:ubiquinone/menaquinone biosynthesis C-methylase UbiE